MTENAGIFLNEFEYILLVQAVPYLLVYAKLLEYAHIGIFSWYKLSYRTTWLFYIFEMNRTSV